MIQRVSTPYVYAYSDFACIFDPMRLYSARVYFYFTRVYFYFTRVYSMQRVHYKQRFKRVTRKHVMGVTIVHAWYHA